MPTSRLPDYSHLAPKIGGSERLDVAVAAVRRQPLQLPRPQPQQSSPQLATRSGLTCRSAS